MNGHHESCSCQPCTIGREIGMDRALELIAKVNAAMARFSDGEGVSTREVFMMRDETTAFLKEHGHE